MIHVFCRLIALILMVIALPNFAASVELSSSASQPASPEATSKRSEATGDGFQQTLQAFEQRVNKGREIVEALQKINSEAKARVPSDLSKQQAYFLMKLGDLYPGSTYDGNKGKVAFQKNFMATFNSSMNVDSISEMGEVTAKYLLHENQIIITFGTNSVIAILDRTKPSASRFNKVSIPAIRVEAETILSFPGYKRITTDSFETSVLNDAYQLLSQTNVLRMEYFASDIMRSSRLQKQALSIAGSGYFERHPQEYVKGVDPVAVAPKSGSGSTKLTLNSTTRFIGTLLVLVLLSVGFFRGARWLIGFVQLQFMDDSARKYVKQYRKLSPLVTRLLEQLGRSLWGRNFLWSRKFYVTKRSDRWTLSDSKIDRYDLHSHPDNLLEVCLRDNNFKIRVTRVRGTAVDFFVSTSDYSRQELASQILELSLAFTREESTSGDAVTPSDSE